MPDKNIVNFKLESIGPFDGRLRLTFDGGGAEGRDGKSIWLGVYASNGIGKTFISRCFGEYAAAMTGKHSYYYPRASLISLGKDAGKFEVDVQIKGGALSKFTMPIDGVNSQIQHTGEAGVIFHVFNSDYVKRQFQTREWIPDGNINGEVIVGEVNAASATLDEEIIAKTADNEVILRRLNDAINLAKDGLRSSYDVRYNASAFQGITFEKIINGVPLPIAKTKAVLVGEYDILKKFAEKADGVADVPKLNSISHSIDASTINKELNEPHIKKAIQDKFLEKIHGNQDFIRRGLDLTKDGKCPYCEQSLDGARELITAYNDYFDTTQKEVERKLKEYKKQFETLESLLGTAVSTSNISVTKFNEIKDYFPSTKDIVVNPIVLPDDLAKVIGECKAAIQSKIADISQIGLDFEMSFGKIQGYIEAMNAQITALNAEIKKVNAARVNSTNELLTIKNGLCTIAFNEIISSGRIEIDRYIANKERMGVVTEELRLLQAKTPRKNLVYSTFCDLIKMYFGDKYSVEEDSFRLRLKAQNLEKPELVLSDGEKSIIAFCYYLADTHSKISVKADYDRVFFVIDDPISSMDFIYVYETAQIIKSLGKIIDGKKPKFLILTHNAEFMNILYGNRLLSQGYHLKRGDGDIGFLKHGFVAPYQNHLKDIYDISEETAEPCHTTYNSMRHILESVMGFVNPTCRDLDTFILTQKLGDNELFEDNGHIKRIINDMSHGRPRLYEEIHKDKTIEGCKELIAYINDRFPGQVPHIQA
jgi:hypothetical protein